MPKRQPPPLTKDQLAAIRERNPGNSDVVALLWEVHRLRQFARRVRQHLVTDSTEGRNELLRETSVEPVVREEGRAGAPPEPKRLFGNMDRDED
jgi:hypothetical protein